jgi:uncharacterized protein (DUF885 family)
MSVRNRAPMAAMRWVRTSSPRWYLKTEGVNVSLDELEAIGRADLKANQDALAKACGIYAPGASMQDCMTKMGMNKAADGPVAEARRQLPPLKQFLIDKDIVSIPGTEEAKVEESPPYNRQNSAYIDIPGPYEKGLPSVYYISPPDPTWDKATQDGFVPGKYDLLGTSVHEVWPGHFLNFLHANRSKSIFGKLFVGYAFAEGWAHYTEEMMMDAGLGDTTGSPEEAAEMKSRPAIKRVVAQLPLPVRHWPARARDDGRAVRTAVQDRMLSGCGQQQATGGARHL